MATPIAHKGVTAGAKVQAMTIIDLLMRPELVQQAWDYFRNVQTKDQKYKPFISDKDQPAMWLNDEDPREVPAGDEEAVPTTRPSTRPISSSWASNTPRSDKGSKVLKLEFWGSVMDCEP